MPVAVNEKELLLSADSPETGLDHTIMEHALERPKVAQQCSCERSGLRGPELGNVLSTHWYPLVRYGPFASAGPVIGLRSNVAVARGN